MPLRDHFHPPLSVYRHWEGLHSKWAGSIVDRLNEELPPRYFAEPQAHRGTAFEVDVATFDARPGAAEEGGVATAIWSPARPKLTLPLPASALESFAVHVFNDEAGPRLVAAIELVSPGNKDRPLSRRTFSIKCGAYLQQGVSLIVADIVTSRTANMHDELMDLLGLSSEGSGLVSALQTSAYRTLPAGDEFRLEIWLEPLALTNSLPTVPLWLNPYEAIAVDLEQSYEAACQSLRIE